MLHLLCPNVNIPPIKRFGVIDLPLARFLLLPSQKGVLLFLPLTALVRIHTLRPRRVAARKPYANSANHYVVNVGKFDQI